MKLSSILSVLLSASLLAMPMAYAKGDKDGKGKCGCMIEKQQEMVQSLNLNDHQKKLWQTYIHSLEKQKANKEKFHALREEAKKTEPKNAVEAAEKRLSVREKMIPIQHDQIKAMKVSVADLKAFYNSLDTHQKAEFDAAFKNMKAKHKDKVSKEACGH